MTPSDRQNGMLTFGGHLEVLRRMLFRIVVVAITLSVVVFCLKSLTFKIILAPHSSDFVSYGVMERIMAWFGSDFRFEAFDVPLINTELSAQFMTHISMSFYVGLLLASPYIVYELFSFISPALYENERRYSYIVVAVVYGLFIIGLLMSYFVIFPISFRFLATYQVDEAIVNTINLSSYTSSFIMLAFMMGVVFQLPVFAWILGKMGFIDADTLRQYRKYAFVIIMIVAAIITPPDIFTLVIVTIPVYALYELSILVLKKSVKSTEISHNQITDSE